MRRADRLFQITLLLGRGKVLTGDTLAARLGVSRRTVYRDIQDFALSGVPIEGEAGAGFRLRGGYQVPPLMFTPEEIQALVFGARLVRSCADKGLDSAADSVLAKVDAVLPANLQHLLDDPALTVPDFRVAPEVKQVLRELRAAAGARRIITFRYTQGDGAVINPRVWPLCLRYLSGTWPLGGWSETEAAFRVFRLYRIQSLVTGSAHFGFERGRTLADFFGSGGPAWRGRLKAHGQRRRQPGTPRTPRSPKPLYAGAAVHPQDTQRRVVMTLCPIAIVAGCKKCPAFAMCPLKGVIGDSPKDEPKADDKTEQLKK